MPSGLFLFGTFLFSTFRYMKMLNKLYIQWSFYLLNPMSPGTHIN